MEILNRLVDEWKRNPEYTNVDAEFFKPPSDQQMVKHCPHGCLLKIYEMEGGGDPWREMIEPTDCYRQTRICREHGYARIYVTTGLLALEVGYDLKA